MVLVWQDADGSIHPIVRIHAVTDDGRIIEMKSSLLPIVSDVQRMMYEINNAAPDELKELASLARAKGSKAVRILRAFLDEN